MRHWFAVIVMIAWSLCSAYAADPAAMPEMDFTQVLNGPNNEPLPLTTLEGKTTQMTLGDAAAMALEASLDEDRNAAGTAKFERDQLARKVYKNAHVVLSPDDLHTIKDRIGKAWGAAVVGAAWPIVDPTLKK
jgi:hypothetical protein